MEAMKKCPYCGEEIMADATKCKYCGEWLSHSAELEQETTKHKGGKDPEGSPRNDSMADSKSKVASHAIEKVSEKPKESLFKSCFWEQITKHYCDFKGSLDRKTYWICYLYYFLLMLVIAGVSVCLPMLGTIIMIVFSLGLILPFLGLTVRRLHDIGKKGTWIFISLVPLVGIIWLLVLLAKKGEMKNLNRWNVKDTIISVAMMVVGCGLFFVPTLSNDFEDDLEFGNDPEIIEFIDIEGVSHMFIEGNYDGYLENGTGYYEDEDNNQYWINAEGVKYIHPYETECDYDEFGNFYCDEVDDGYEEENLTNESEDIIYSTETNETSNNKIVVIDGSELRLRLGPSTSSETLKWSDGSNRHPEVGEQFRYLDETSDFYKIDYKSNEVWVSKQFTHVEMQ